MQQPKFEIGDRVTYASPKLPYQKNRGIGVVVWEMVSHYYIRWENSPVECPHLKDAYDESDLLMQVTEINLGDRVKNLDSNSEGIVTHVCDRCINITTDDSIESHNLELGKPNLKVLENVSGTDKKDVPETSIRRYGHIEDYIVKGRKGEAHKYRRYVYCVSGTHKKHHIPNRQEESIETLWRSGASAKEICLALGKSCK